MSRIGAEASVGGDRRDPSSGLLASESAATYYSNVLDEGGHLFARLQWAGHVELDAEREEMEQRARHAFRFNSTCARGQHSRRRRFHTSWDGVILTEHAYKAH